MVRLPLSSFPNPNNYFVKMKKASQCRSNEKNNSGNEARRGNRHHLSTMDWENTCYSDDDDDNDNEKAKKSSSAHKTKKTRKPKPKPFPPKKHENDDKNKDKKKKSDDDDKKREKECFPSGKW